MRYARAFAPGQLTARKACAVQERAFRALAAGLTLVNGRTIRLPQLIVILLTYISGASCLTWAGSPAAPQAKQQAMGVFNVKAYGAAGDGKTDDTAAVQTAVAASNRAGGGVVYFPAGTYKITAAIKSVSINTSFEGAGKHTSTLMNAGTGDAIFIDPARFTIARGGFFEHLGIGCAPLLSPPRPGTTGIHAYAMTGWLYEDLFIYGCGTGIELQNQNPNVWTEETRLSQVMLSNDHFGIELRGSGSASSFAYSEFDFYCEINASPPAASGACFYDNGGWLYNGFLRIRVNMPAKDKSLGPDVIQMDDFAKVNPLFKTQVVGEGADGQPVLAVGDATLVYGVQLNSSVYGAVPYLKNKYPAWSASKAYSVGAAVKPGCPSGDIMMAVNAGTSGSAAPRWNCGRGTAVSLDLTTVDNNITWRDVGQYPGANGGMHDPIVGAMLTVQGTAISNSEPVGVAYGSGAPSVPCYQGNLYVNLAGSSGSTLYVCVRGKWTDVK
jgi:hypothetical protein